MSRGVVALWPTLPRDLGAAGFSVTTGPDRGPAAPVPDLVVLARPDLASHDLGRRRADRPRAAGVVCVVPAGHRDQYAGALDAGAAGVVPDDAPAAHVVRAVEAALRGQVLLPVDVLRDWLGRVSP